jgi:uncharacterized protein YegJ (DUF2314 family)
MISIARTCVIALLALVGCSKKEGPPAAEVATPPHDLIINTVDTQLDAATERARDTLPKFEQRLTDPPPSQTFIALKGRFEADGVVEHLFISEVVVTEAGYRGKLVTEPTRLKNFTLGQALVVPRDSVSDWFAIENDRLVAGYRMRVERSQLSAVDRAAFDSHMGFQITD